MRKTFTNEIVYRFIHRSNNHLYTLFCKAPFKISCPFKNYAIYLFLSTV